MSVAFFQSTKSVKKFSNYILLETALGSQEMADLVQSEQ